MKFIMNTQDLLEGLNTVTRALAARPAKQILDGVLIVAQENRIHLTCSDGSLSIEYTNAADVSEEDVDFSTESAACSDQMPENKKQSFCYECG